MAQVEVPSQDPFGPQLSQRGLHVDCVPGHDRVGHRVALRAPMPVQDVVKPLARPKNDGSGFETV